MAKSKKEVAPEVAPEEVITTKEVTPAVEVPLNATVSEREDPGHNTRAFRQ